jgi:hypothetical protein
MSNTLWNKKRSHQTPDSLTHSAGTISAVFGSTTLNASLSGLTAMTLYYLYVRKVSGVTSLVYVTTAPQAMRALFSDAVLVGAFFADGMTSVGFGSFVNIEGSPESNVFNYQGSGNWTNVIYSSRARVVGDKIELNQTISFTGAPSSGVFAPNLPTNLSMPTTKLSSTTGFNYDSNLPGRAKMIVGSAYDGSVLRNSDTSYVLSYLDVNANAAFVTPTLPAAFSTTGHYIHVEVILPITGFSNTPLKDR